MEAFMKRLSVLFIALVVAAPALAQEMMPAPAVGMVKTMEGNFNYVKGFIVRSAEEMPEADFAFKPTPEVRSFGQIIGHVADANYGICSIVLGEANPSPGVEKNKTSKADLVAALKASYEYCGRAYAMPDKDIGMKIKLFGQENTRLGGLLLNITHNWEHYGNIVTYLRLKGHVPPSSQPTKK
jgi:uncharacterized damage-inducible protein DinB